MCLSEQYQELLDFVGTDCHKVNWLLAAQGWRERRTGKAWAWIYRKLEDEKKKENKNAIHIGRDIFSGGFDDSGNLVEIDHLKFDRNGKVMDIATYRD